MKNYNNKIISFISGLITLFCILGFGSKVHAEVITVAFVNGVNTKLIGAQEVMRELESAYKTSLTNKHPDKTFDFQVAYNDSDSLMKDVLETLKQKRSEYPNISIELINEQLFILQKSGEPLVDAVKDFSKVDNLSIESTAYIEEVERIIKEEYLSTRGTVALDDYKKIKADVQNMLQGDNRLILIAHSQGNLYANQLMKDLRPEDNDSSCKIDMIGLASAASESAQTSNTPHLAEATYYTAEDDRVINFLRLLFPTTLAANVDNSNGKKRGFIRHGFLKAYFQEGLESRTNLDADVESFIPCDEEGIVPVYFDGDAIKIGDDYGYVITSDTIREAGMCTSVFNCISGRSYRWDFDGDGVFDTQWQYLIHTHPEDVEFLRALKDTVEPTVRAKKSGRFVAVVQIKTDSSIVELKARAINVVQRPKEEVLVIVGSCNLNGTIFLYDYDGEVKYWNETLCFPFHSLLLYPGENKSSKVNALGLYIDDKLVYDMTSPSNLQYGVDGTRRFEDFYAQPSLNISDGVHKFKIKRLINARTFDYTFWVDCAINFSGPPLTGKLGTPGSNVTGQSLEWTVTIDKSQCSRH